MRVSLPPNDRPFDFHQQRGLRIAHSTTDVIATFFPRQFYPVFLHPLAVNSVVVVKVVPPSILSLRTVDSSPTHSPSPQSCLLSFVRTFEILVKGLELLNKYIGASEQTTSNWWEEDVELKVSSAWRSLNSRITAKHNDTYRT
ncbi:hypothetical protein PVK06_028137 [Gossypium arboreum]|uniref:Uncharacterized protein n=1 Tax=Gossypium arboreum TaxID=29729 RepID=A0ABR0P3K0_GOSAR|nr:hypothetical protein PVK06_028137 [Gossypium arboreum]